MDSLFVGATIEGRAMRFPRLGAASARSPKASRISCVLPQDKDLQLVQNAKMNLLQAVLDTDRGFRTTLEQRGLLEESMVEVEKYDTKAPLDLDKLDGTWRLQYTSAPDVISIFQAGEFPYFKPGQIYLKFECKGRFDGGTVVNVVRWSIPWILRDAEGATLFLTAGFFVVGARTIQLVPTEVRLTEISLSEQFHSFLAAFLKLEILQALREVDVRVPLLEGSPAKARREVGVLYNLTYLDNDMLIVRAHCSKSVSVFGRTQMISC